MSQALEQSACAMALQGWPIDAFVNNERSSGRNPDTPRVM